jgi:hypothetical protein
MDGTNGTHERTERVGSGRRAAWRRWTVLGTAVVVVAVGLVLGARGLRAAVSPTISVNPGTTSQLYYQPTPVSVTINIGNLRAPGLTPVSGYQYGLQWDPTVLRWLSGPDVGPGTSTPQPVLPCSEVISTAVTFTPTPTWFVATYTPTFTNTPTVTNTPGLSTPTATSTPRTPTDTPTPSPTPSGYIRVACASLSNATPIASGVVGTFRFQPLATAETSSPLRLMDVKLVNFIGAPITPGPVLTSGNVLLAGCHDVNGDGIVDLVDLTMLAGGYLSVLGSPNYVAAYDINGDGTIDISDLTLVAAGYLFTC